MHTHKHTILSVLGRKRGGGDTIKHWEFDNVYKTSAWSIFMMTASYINTTVEALYRDISEWELCPGPGYRLCRKARGYSFNYDTINMHGPSYIEEVHKTTPEMRTPPSIRTPCMVPAT